MAIKTLTIRAVRGVRKHLPIEIGGKSLLVQGDNGTGKSSMVTALEWVLRGERGPTGGAAFDGEEGFRAHVLEAPEAPAVDLQLTNGGQISIDTKVTKVSGGADAYRESCMRADPFLRRSQLLEFLGQRPIDRFRYLESFLDLGEADNIRARLEDRASVLKVAAQAQKHARQSRLEAINSTIPAGRRPLAVTWDSLERVLSAWAVELQLVPTTTPVWSEIEEAANTARTPVKDDTAAQRARLGTLVTDARSARNNVTTLPDLDEATRSLRAAVAKSADGSLITLLESARVHIAAKSGENCPVCEQAVDPNQLVKALDARLTSLRDVRALTTAKATCARTWQDALDHVGRFIASAQHQSISSKAVMPNGATELKNLVDIDAFADTVVAIGTGQIREWMVEAVSSIMMEVERQLAEPIRQDDSAERALFAQCVDEATRQLASYDLRAFPEQQLDEQAKQLTAVSEAIRRARQDVAQKLLDEIAGFVSEYYRQIHPSDAEAEVTGAPSLEVQRNRGGVAYLRGTFHDRTVEDPRWVYSDGHLDTVGLCVFLALRRFRANQKGDAKLMVLDDVVLSIDLGHARRLLQVLREKFNDHQILIFTHSGLFASWVATLLPSFQRKAITGWSLEGGVRLGDFVSAAERLENDLNTSSSPKQVAQSMMTLMDEILLDARFAYQLAVPAKRGEQYTLSELWEPFVKRLKDLEKALKSPLGSASKLLTELTGLPQIRNQLAAHENDFARDFPLSTIKGVSRACLDLISLVYCTECCAFAEPIPDRNNPIAASCRCRRLIYQAPLKLVPAVPAATG